MKVKKTLLTVLTTTICILPIVCGFVVIYTQAGFRVGQSLAGKLAEYVNSL